ncbi:MAG: class I SAM-dependent methyltransferase [Bacteroidales bacterium]|jgi:predicted O-methyltransferase YrrM|nr:class I SAM-dependent methyltransferase [Bacteroidales bacterium]MBR0313530.1 class I SAM-dependent methyltransferase [Bacteroidales bacterium]
MEKLLSALNWIERQTHTRTNHAQMLVGREEGLFLRDFVLQNNCKHVLEIGTFTGYSLACLADGAKKLGGSVDAIEINKELDYIIEEGLQRAGVAELVKVHYGDALEILPSIAEEYDLVFIDADKRQYPQYYELVKPLVRSGGYILADNVTWYGRTSSHTDAKSSGISSFNSLVESDSSVESHLVDIRDGLLVIRCK